MREILIQIPTSTSAVIRYLPAFENCTVLGAKVVNTGIPTTNDAVVSLLVGSTTIGVATVADDAAVGTVTSAVMDTTLATRKTPITATAPLIISTDGGQTVTTGFDILVRFDDSALTRD